MLRRLLTEVHVVLLLDEKADTVLRSKRRAVQGVRFGELERFD